MSARGEHRFVIDPLKGVGPIRFGMHKDEVSHAFTYVYRSFFKTRKSTVRSDQIEVVGLIIHYDDESRVSYIEITAPVHGAVALELFGVDITGYSVREFVELLKSHAASVTRDGNGYQCAALGLNTYNTDPRSDDAKVECIGMRPNGEPPATRAK
jgi:hypothetical protein